MADDVNRLIEMHREFRKLLAKAEGEGDFVIVANIDIRGFSKWSQEVESVQAATYLAKLYVVVIDKWFKKRWFFKPTGDGLLLVRPFKERELGKVAEESLESSVEIVNTFGSLCNGMPMLNFDLPQEVGVGLAQGAASRLVANGKVLDYSGSVLNRASRLMDLARPRGVVFDGGLAPGLLSKSILDQFGAVDVYLRGVSPRDPLKVYALKNETEIPAVNLSPIGEISWGKPISVTSSLRDMEKPSTTWHTYAFPEAPSDLENVKCSASHETMDLKGRKISGGGWTRYQLADTAMFGLQEEAGVNQCKLDYHAIAKMMRGLGAKANWPIRIQVDYPV